jgi:hypothetical protein
MTSPKSEREKMKTRVASARVDNEDLPALGRVKPFRFLVIPWLWPALGNEQLQHFSGPCRVR